MLNIARKAIHQYADLANRLQVHRWRISREENPLRSKAFHALVSNRLHHMDDPRDLWRRILDRAATNSVVPVMDHIRTPGLTGAKNIVEKYAADEPEVLKADFLNSLRAAYRPAEIRKELATLDIGSLRVEIVSDRHLAIFGSIG